MEHFVEWDSLDVRVSGDRINQLAATMVVPPLEKIALRFSNGVLRVEGSIRKFVSVPFQVEIAEMLAAGMTVRVPVRSASAFGGMVPIPRFLFGLVKSRLPADVVRFEEPATFVILLDRFLPPFISAEIQKIWIIEGGLAVSLGRGGADLPAGALQEGLNE
ncbi:MAG TPA: hypothetical protein VFL80_01135, partial [Thermoanaerobaculia bacterium]|nr:hypothetical protein [Thermoanaerobaculia bacterium]